MNLITISRGSLSGAKSFAEGLSQTLGFPVIRREQVIEEAKKYSIAETGFSDISFIDKPPSIWQRQFNRRKHYLLAFQVALLDLIDAKSCIYEGHLGQFLLTDIPFLLKLRIIQPMDKRTHNFMIDENIDNYETARYMIKQIDERRRNWSEFLYGVNWEEPQYYDMVYNLDNMEASNAINITVNALKEIIYESTSDSLITLQDLHLTTKAKLQLFLTPMTRGIDVDITSNSAQGSVYISGISSTMDIENSDVYIRETLSVLDGIKEVIIN